MKVPPLPVIVRDTNEIQHGHAYEFAGFKVQSGNLFTGDYSLLGHENRVVVERKTKADWYGCLAGRGGGNRKRWRDCLGRLAEIDHPACVIECDLDSLAIPPAYSTRTGSQAIGAYISWQEEFGFPIIPAPSREWAERCALRWMQAYWRHLHAPTRTSP